MCTYMFWTRTDMYRPDIDLVRTRDSSILAQCDILVDVGGVYDVAAQQFDHYQRSFKEVLIQGILYPFWDV